MKPRRLPPAFTEREIQHAAYFLWEAAGRPRGRDLEFWLEAQERLRHQPRRHWPGPANPAAKPARNAQPGSPAIR